MGPLLLLVFAGQLGLSMAMGNSTVNGTSANMTMPHGNNNTMPHGHNNTMPHGNNNTMPHGNNNTMPHGNNNTMPHGNNNTMPHGNNNTMPHGNNNTMPHGNNNTMPHGNNNTMPHGNNNTMPHGNNNTMPHGNNNTMPHGNNMTCSPGNGSRPPCPSNNTTMPETGSRPKKPKVNLKFALLKTFVVAFNDLNSAESQELVQAITSNMDPVYRNRFGDVYERLEVIGFSKGSVVADINLIFSNTSNVPNTSAVVDTLTAAVSGGNFSLAVNTSSIVAAVVPTNAATTVAPATKVATAAATAAAGSTVDLKFSLIENFTSDLLNSSSPVFQALKSKLETTFNTIGKKLFPSDFLSAVVKSFAKGSVVTTITMNFANASSVPSTDSLTSSLKTELSNSSLNVNLSSIVVTSSSSAVTAAASNSTANVTAAATSGPSTDAPSSTEGTLGLQFTMKRNFTNDLSNSSSAAYKTLAGIVIKVVNTACQDLFTTNFRRSLLNSFKSGSVKADMTLVFKDKSSVPSAESATSLLSAKLANSSLGVVNGSVSAQSTTTSGCHPEPPMLSLLSATLAMMAVAQMLVRF